VFFVDFLVGFLVGFFLVGDFLVNDLLIGDFFFVGDFFCVGDFVFVGYFFGDEFPDKLDPLEEQLSDPFELE
jgi:hypothetical protein